MSTDRRCALARLLAAAALLVATPAAAASPTAQPPRSPRAVAAPVSSAVPLPPPPPGTTLRPSAATSASPGLWNRPWRLDVSTGPAVALGGGLGPGAALRLDAFTPLSVPWARIRVEGGASVAVASYFTRTDHVAASLPALAGFPTYPGFPGYPGYPGTTIPGLPSDTVQRSAISVALVPTARLLFPLTPAVTLYTNGGLGLAEVLATTMTDAIFVGKTEVRTASTALVLRLGIGLAYAVGERLSLTAEPVGLDLHVGSDASALTVLVGAAYRL